MSCNKCKKKNTTNDDTDFVEVNGDNKNSIPRDFDIAQGFDKQSFLIRLVTFFLIVAGFPLIYLTIIIMLFFQFFLPKKGVPNLLNGTIEWIATRYVAIKIKRQEKRRQREFDKNRGYTGDSELLDIEVYETEENNVGEDEK